ncbi:hypothetical protein RCS94_09880 [Orbaceae bacterium ac157xtp]
MPTAFLTKITSSASLLTHLKGQGKRALLISILGNFVGINA